MRPYEEKKIAWDSCYSLPAFSLSRGEAEPGEDVAQCVAVGQHERIDGRKEGVELRQRTEEALSHEVLGLKMQARSYRETKKTKWTNEEESM